MVSLNIQNVSSARSSPQVSGETAISSLLGMDKIKSAADIWHDVVYERLMQLDSNEPFYYHVNNNHTLIKHYWNVN